MVELSAAFRRLWKRDSTFNASLTGRHVRRKVRAYCPLKCSFYLSWTDDTSIDGDTHTGLQYGIVNVGGCLGLRIACVFSDLTLALWNRLNGANTDDSWIFVARLHNVKWSVQSSKNTIKPRNMGKIIIQIYFFIFSFMTFQLSKQHTSVNPCSFVFSTICSATKFWMICPRCS